MPTDSTAGDSQETRWSLLDAAATGDEGAREAFADTYLPIVRSFLGARWRDQRSQGELDDAAQDVFVECLRPGGALSRVDPQSPGKFRTFLFSVVRNVARRHEERWRKEAARKPDQRPATSQMVADDDERASKMFDRAWAIGLLQRAAERMRAAAATMDERAQRRVELLDLRFGEGLPIRKIALRFQEDAARVHREYARARVEFKDALIEELSEQSRQLGAQTSRAQLESECEELLALLA